MSALKLNNDLMLTNRC